MERQSPKDSFGGTLGDADSASNVTKETDRITPNAESQKAGRGDSGAAMLITNRLRSAVFGRKPLDIPMDKVLDCLEGIIDRPTVDDSVKIAASGVLARIDSERNKIAMHLHKEEMIRDATSGNGASAILLIRGVSIDEV